MNCSPIEQPDSGMDCIVYFKRKSVFSSINPNSVQTLQQPYNFFFPKPILPLSSYIIKNPPYEFKSVPFPILINLFNEQFQKINKNELYQCPNCHSKFHSSIPEQCPFCHPSCLSKVPSSYLITTKEQSTIKNDIFIIIIAGDQPDVFYESFLHFQHKYILISYDDNHFTILTKRSSSNGSTFQQITLLDSNFSIPSSYILEHVNATLPHFPPSKSHKVDLNTIISSFPSLQLLQSNYFHFCFFTTIPHFDLQEFNIPNATVSVFSNNSMDCDCSSLCESTGGFFIPFIHSLCFGYNSSFNDLIFVRSISFQSPIAHSHLDKPTLIYPGRYLIDKTLLASDTSKVPFINFQIEIETNDSLYIISGSFEKQRGIREFLSQASLPNFLIASEIEKIIAKYSESGESIAFPNSLRHSPLFKQFYSPMSFQNINVIDRFMWKRPFVWQIQPTIRVPEYLSSQMATTLSVFLIIYKSVIYIWMGSELKVKDWEELIGRKPEPNNISFELSDQGFNSILWTAIRELRQYFPFPVIIVPGESGRRVQLVEILSVDWKDGNNLILNSLAQIANLIPE